ncbi:MAG TPA: biotin--[acetyl-CoA-carboxylase] ligase [Puia sp.]|nr:biotin--[acetyl-CoA-carboxylase] ligase [Puia sp.]
MPHPAINLSAERHFQPVGHQLVELKSVDSTNNYAMAKVHAGLAAHGSVFTAYEQTAGKGQRHKKWTSSPGRNITMSIVLEPVFLPPAQQFALSACVALACYHFLKKYIPEGLSIKWPNDLYWNDRKAGGILIESILKGNQWLTAVAGIGINVNQVRFPEGAVNPVSLKQITGKDFDLRNLIGSLCAAVEEKFTELRTGSAAQILDQYNQVLFMRGKTARLRKGSVVFETRIREVSPGGQLMTTDQLDRSFDFGEVEWLL